MKKAFTTIEVLVAIAVLGLLLFVFVAQKNEISQKMRDQQRKASINALYFNLTQIYYKKNGYYPEFLKPELIDGVDPAIFSDPKKVLLGDQGSDYAYVTSNCQDNKCQKFKLSAKLELEAEYIKESR